MPVGRPKLTLEEAMPTPKAIEAMGFTSWQQLILKEMGEGASKEEIKALLDVSNDLYERLIKEEPEFSDTIKRGELLSKAWWQRIGRTSLLIKDFSYVGWYMNMKNRFGWKDRNDVTSNDEKLEAPHITLDIKE